MDHRARTRRSPWALLAFISVISTASLAQDGTDCDGRCEAAQALIERFDLRTGPIPVRDRFENRRPRRIVVADPYIADQIRDLVPSSQIIAIDGLRNFAEIAEVIDEAEILIGLCAPEVIARARRLQWIQLLNAGADTCTGLPELVDRDIPVTNLQRIQGPHMAEHAIAMMFALARSLPQYGLDQHTGTWSRGLRGVGELKLIEIEGKTLLVVGLGGIGTEVARRGAALGMRVIATRASRREGPDYVDYVGLADEASELAAQSDFVVNATPLTPDTTGMFDAQFFSAMKPSAYFINIGRGESVVTEDLSKALQSSTIAGAGLDVTDPEPLPKDHPLWTMANVLLTPHIATRSDHRNERTAILVYENLRRYLEGEALLSEVNLARGY